MGQEIKEAIKTEKTGNGLIQRDGKGNWQLKDVRWDELIESAVLTRKTAQRIYGALCKLKDYEEAGDTPDKVREAMEDLNYIRETIDKRYRAVTEKIVFQRQRIAQWYKENQPGEAEEKGTELADLLTEDLQEEQEWLELLAAEDMEEKEQLTQIAQHYGWAMQSTVCMEECAELIKALAKYRRVWGSTAPLSAMFRSKERNNVIEEMADVLNMVDQLIFLMDAKDETEKARKEKIQRELKRLGRESD